jgi:hypothetical protein
MHVVAPDLLAEGRELSVAVLVTGLLLGLSLWLLGWRGHRFWIVLAATLGGGIAVLMATPADGVQPLVGGLLAAVAAGVLALALVRVVAFLGGGLIACMAAHAVAPEWNQPLLAALVGGLVGVLLFRLWTMVLTSLAGTLLVVYSALCLLDTLGTLDAVAWAERDRVLLNWACGGGTLLGVLAQYLLERRRARKQRQREEKARAKAAEEAEKKRRPPPKRWWEWGQRRAG